MNRSVYELQLDMLTDVTRPLLIVADDMDLAGMRDTVGQMEALAPVLEPTAYMRGGGMNLQDQAAFLAAVDRFVTEVRKLDRRPADTNT